MNHDELVRSIQSAGRYLQEHAEEIAIEEDIKDLRIYISFEGMYDFVTHHINIDKDVS